MQRMLKVEKERIQEALAEDLKKSHFESYNMCVCVATLIDWHFVRIEVPPEHPEHPRPPRLFAGCHE